MSRFPLISETFILREMVELEWSGWHLELYPLVLEHPPVVHDEAKPWIARAHFISLLSGEIFIENLRMFFQQPLNYISTMLKAIWGNRSSINFLLRAIFLFPKAVWMARHMPESGVVHIHAHYASHSSFVAWLINRLTGIPFSVTVHAHDIFKRKTMLATKLKEAQFIIAISDFNVRYLEDIVGSWVTDKMHVIHCGIIPELYSPREAEPGPSETFEVINIGSLQLYKGHRHLIEACKILRDKGIPIHCRIIGSGELHGKLKLMISTYGLDGIVELVGMKTQKEVAMMLPTAHCYVQPSIVGKLGKMEGIPVSLMEALACSVPVIATDLSGIPELVRDCETGFLVAPNSAEALSEAMLKVFHEPEYAQNLACAGRSLVLQEFELTKNVKRLSSIFDTITPDRIMN